MTPAEFIDKWRDANFGEKQASQEMFLDICRLVNHPTPVEYGDKDSFTFEKGVPGGFADAYLEGRFGWEFKGGDDQLDGAFNQLLRYQVYLKTPPLLIVSSFRTILIRTNFPGMETVLHEIPVTELSNPDNLKKLRCAFFAPADLRPDRSVEDVTKETADLFRDIVTDMEQRNQDPERLARFLNQIVFCLYAEDAGLLPDGLFTQVVGQQFRNADLFNLAVGSLFEQMATGGMFGADAISYFNGDLFNLADTVELSAVALQRLGEATGKNWQNIEPSIFGTLFERALDASKRSQLGAHYTSAGDIMLVVEPVVMAPLRQEWKTARQEIEGFLNDDYQTAALDRLVEFQKRLSTVTVLDPACGSGNFLYLALRSLLDLEKNVIDFGTARGWHELSPTVSPSQMLGLEINHYATELARTALWIGYIQWHQAHGFPYKQSPILTPLDTIQQTDAIIDLTDPFNPKEPVWPAAEFIISNPPFLGHVSFREQLGDEYVDAIYSLYGERIPNSSDLCCYWFEKARERIVNRKVRRAGLLATQAIRLQSSRRVLTRIGETGGIFMAWPDQPWILEGAAVNISIVGFDDGSDTMRELNGKEVATINSNLTEGLDLNKAVKLQVNLGIAFMGDTKGGPFDIADSLAQEMIKSPNPHGKSNAEVLKPWVNGKDITDRPKGKWIVDFGDMPLEQAAFYELPFEYVNSYVRPKRERSRTTVSAWWKHERPRPEMREALSSLKRFISTPETSKHRFFCWLGHDVLPSNSVIAIAFDDDYHFGLLNSSTHLAWALAVGGRLVDRPRYTISTCFETFPFPEPNNEQMEDIAGAARELNELRESWLNPPDVSQQELKSWTLTNLYNTRPTWLQLAHQLLDNAVSAAYGWPEDLDDQAILERLLALNLERATSDV